MENNKDNFTEVSSENEEIDVKETSNETTQNEKTPSEFSVKENTETDKENNIDSINLEKTQIIPNKITTGGDQSIKMDNSWNETKKKKKLFILIPVLVCSLILIIVGLVINSYLQPKAIFTRVISESFDTIEKSLNDTDHNSVLSEGNISYKISSNDEDIQSILDIVNGFEFNYKYAIDYKNKIMNVDIDSKYNKKDLLEMGIYGKDNKMYLSLKDIFDKYISADIENYNQLFENSKSIEEQITIMNSIEKALVNSLEKNDFEKEEVKVNINGKDEKVNKISLVLTNKNAPRIAKKLLQSLKEDKKFIKAISEITSTKESEISSDLKDLIENVEDDNDTDDNSEIRVSIYTKGLLNKFVGMNFTVNVENERISFEAIEDTEEELSFVLTNNDNKLASGVIEVKTKGKNTASTITINVPDVVNIKLNLNSKVEYDKKVKETTISNSVDYEELTEEDMQGIITKLYENETLVEVIENVQSIFEAIDEISTDDYDYDNNQYNEYDYDDYEEDYGM